MSTRTRVRVSASASDRLELALAVSHFLALPALDHAWTALVEGGEVTEWDQDVLAMILTTMARDLEGARRGAEWLREFVLREKAEAIRAGLIDLVETAPDDQRGEFAELDSQYGEQIGKLTEVGYQVMIATLPQQRLELVERYAEVLRGAAAAGDLLKNMVCSLAALTISAGLVTAVLPPHVHGPAIVGAGAVAFRLFKCNLDELERVGAWRLRPA